VDGYFLVNLTSGTKKKIPLVERNLEVFWLQTAHAPKTFGCLENIFMQSVVYVMGA